MAQRKTFDKAAMLTTPSLPDVYRSIFEMAQEFAILGHVQTASTLISLLLSEGYSSKWQRWQIRYLKFAFAQTDQWPEQIPPEERTEEVLREYRPQMEAHLEDEDDVSKLETLLKHATDDTYSDGTTGSGAMERSAALADALSLAIKLASEDTSSLEEIERDAKVQEILGLISKRLHADHQIEYLTERRNVWPLLSSGALACKVPVDQGKVEALAKEAIDTFMERLKSGRKQDSTEQKSILDLLKELEHNTKTNGVSFYIEAYGGVPETLFQLPPASDQQIVDLEKKLDVTLPDDYKEFLKTSNGFGGTWNGFYADPPLNPVDKVDWTESYTGDLPIELHESPTGIMDLPCAMGREWNDWPRYKKVLQIGQEDVFDVWMLPPPETKRVVEAYNEVMVHPQVSEDKKRETRNLIASKYNSWEDFEKLSWVVFEMDEGRGQAHGSFKKFLEEKVRKSATVSEEEGKEERCFAYSCKPDSAE